MKVYIPSLRKLGYAGVVFCLALNALAAPPLSTPAEFSGKAFNREEALQQRDEVHRWLMAEQLESGLRNPLTANVDADEAAAIDKGGSSERPMRVGLTKTLSAAIDFSDLNMSGLNRRIVKRQQGAISGTEDGGFIYSTALSSPGAAAVRVHFTGFKLPPQTGVFLYTEDGQVFGPYTGRGPLGDGEFWSHTLVGDYVMLQLRHVGTASDEDLHGSGFNVAGLGHIRPNFMAGTCSDNASCVVNAECVTLGTEVVDLRKAVAEMQWIAGAFIYMCTGGLLADTDTSSVIPYFLSANHCISRGKDARSLENFFQLTKPCNTGSCPSIYDIRDNYPQDLRTLGATIVSTGSSADYTLFRLQGPTPVDSTYLGWNANPVAFTDNAQLFRISHPGGSPQSYSEHSVDTSAPTCTSWPRGNRIYSRDTYGATEGGSSGSPVVNSTGEVVGQLSGACGYNVQNSCDSGANATVDGAFSAYFSQVSQYLAPEPGTCSPEPEICDDGIDNDCDGAIDSADSDCSTGGDPTGDPTGSACLVDSDCASNNCKGRPGSKTCK